MWLLAGALSLLSLIGALRRTRRLAMPTPVRVAWVAICGLPAFAALWLLYRPQEMVASDPLDMPETAAA